MVGYFTSSLLAFSLVANTGHLASDYRQVKQDSVIRISTTTSPFEGSWEWEKNDINKNFVLNIKREGNLLKGTYCCVMQKGAKVDCPVKKEVSFVAPVPGVTSFTTYFKSAYSQLNGQVKITFDGFNIIWEIIAKPKGQSYFPTNAVLLKQR